MNKRTGLLIGVLASLGIIGFFVYSARQSILKIETASGILRNVCKPCTANKSSLLTSDGTVRHCITRATVRFTLNKPTKQFDIDRQFEEKETPTERKNSFQTIYQKGHWGGITHEVDPRVKSVEGSGPSSTLQYTQEIIGVLHTVINELKLVLQKPKIRLLDIPCGDFQWMFRLLVQRDDIIYTGMDIVPLLIDNHKKAFKGYKDWTFIQGDIVEAPPPGQYDLVMTRIMLNHLHHNSVLKTLANINKVGQYFLLTTNPGEDHNIELDSLRWARYRHLNFEIPPISLEPPLCMARDGPPYRARSHAIGLWKLPLHQVASCSIQRMKIPSSISKYDYFVCG